jgi:lipopolysaccharide export system protein LptA
MTTEQDVITARDSFEYWEEMQVAVARGDAVAIRGDRRVRADSLTAHMSKGADGKQSIQRVDAIGNVQISTATDSVQGDKGIYYVDRQFAKLFGNVQITRGENQMNGAYAEVDLQSGISKLMAAPPGTQAADRVRGLLIPKKKPDQPAQPQQQ